MSCRCFQCVGFRREPTADDEVATQLHYPQCWDVAAYPTLMDAVLSFICNKRFDCNCDECPDKGTT